jgi:predicted GH43/DUF377 family glycosyl hydrolase
MKIVSLVVMSAAMLGSVAKGEPVIANTDGEGACLFASFRDNGEDGLHLAYSRDGLKWTAIKDDKSFLKPTVGGKLMRDPCIIQGPDGLFHMVWTTSWSDKGIGIAHSKDLISWSEQEFVPVMQHEPEARNCWAPEIAWDPDAKHYVIYWATTIPDRFTETANAADKKSNHRIYATTTRDFKSYTRSSLFYDPGFNVIDSTIIRANGEYVMISKDETSHPPAKNLHLATSDKLAGPWKKASGPFSPKGLWVEGPTAIRIGEFLYLYYDVYKEGRYGVMRTKDLKSWENVSDGLIVPKGMRHGTVLSISNDVLAQLLQQE